MWINGPLAQFAFFFKKWQPYRVFTSLLGLAVRTASDVDQWTSRAIRLFPHISVWGSYFYWAASRSFSSCSFSSRPLSLLDSLSLILTTLTLTLTLTSHSHSHSYSLSHTHSLTHSRTLSLSLSLSLTLTHSLSLTLSLSLSLTLTLSHSYSFTLTHSRWLLLLLLDLMLLLLGGDLTFQLPGFNDWLRRLVSFTNPSRSCFCSYKAQLVKTWCIFGK